MNKSYSKIFIEEFAFRARLFYPENEMQEQFFDEGFTEEFRNLLKKELNLNNYYQSKFENKFKNKKLWKMF